MAPSGCGRNHYRYSRLKNPLGERKTERLLTFWNQALAPTKRSSPGRVLTMLVDDFVDHAIFFGLFGIHDEVPLDVFFDALDGLAAVLSEQPVDHGAHAKDFLGMQIDIGGLAAETGEPWLMNKDAGIGQGKTLLGRATGEQDSSDGSSLSDASGHNVGFHELHGVVDGESCGDGAARRVDIELDIALWIFGLEEQHLCCGQVGDMVVNGSTNKDNVLFEEPRVYVIGAFPTAGLFNHHGYKRCGAISWVVVEIFHEISLSGQARTALLCFFCCGHRANSGILCE